MQPLKEKLSNVASAAKVHVNIGRAKAEETIEKAAARTPEEREMAQERRKAKKEQGKMEFHDEIAQHKAERLDAKQQHSDQYPIPTPGGEYPMDGATTAGAAPTTGATGPTLPVAGHQLDKLGAKQQSHPALHQQQQQHDEYENPIPTPGGVYPMGSATTAAAAPMAGATFPTRPVAAHPPTTKYL